jgi:hypothetical protein
MDDDNYLRDIFACFAMLKMSWNRGDEVSDSKDCYFIADCMMEARKPKEEIGIVAVKRTLKKEK